MILGSGTVTVPGYGSAGVIVYPQVDFEPRFLYIPDNIAFDFMVCSLTVDRYNIFGSSGEIPAITFSFVRDLTRQPDLPGLEKLLGRLGEAMTLGSRIAKVGSQIILRVRNINPAQRNFSCSYFGIERNLAPICDVALDDRKEKVEIDKIVEREYPCYGCSAKMVVSALGQLCSKCR